MGSIRVLFEESYIEIMEFIFYVVLMKFGLMDKRMWFVTKIQMLKIPKPFFFLPSLFGRLFVFRKKLFAQYQNKMGVCIKIQILNLVHFPTFLFNLDELMERLVGSICVRLSLLCIIDPVNCWISWIIFHLCWNLVYEKGKTSFGCYDKWNWFHTTHKGYALMKL